MSRRRAARCAAAAGVAVELVWAGCRTAGVRVPEAVAVGAAVLLVAVFGFECAVLGRLWWAARRAGAGRRAALGAVVREAVPGPVRRLVAHEARSLGSLGPWLLRKRHGVPEGTLAAAYTGPQTALVYGLLFVALVETLVLALVIPWPVVHAVVLVLDGYGVVFVLAFHASCVTRPHVVEPGGGLRIRYGALFDLRVPAGTVAAARVDRRSPEGGPLRVGADGVLDLAVGGQTTVTVELADPVDFVRPWGKRGRARTVRFHADDPGAVVAALTRRPGGTSASPDRSGRS
ncbi:hypothetical protein [Streptomyces sp. PTD5-9]|uniref:hypothetical protein n=1 Tax=Streptomyces sp. PTD5-9 TaxID=3120150 RepID=UPI00300A2F88